MFEKLERSAVKVARCVLRGRDGGNTVLLLGTGLLCELVMRKVKKMNYRIALCAALLVALLLTWIELAVGLFGTPFAGS